jgi:hypothetical protein
MKKITVTVVNGKPTVSTDGFSGDECVRATENLERLLAGEGGVEIREFNANTQQERGYETN